MPTYATQADATANIEGLTIDNPVAFDRLLERAERDVDYCLGARVPLSTTGLKLDPSRLASWERRALARAVCAQVEYLLTRKSDELVTGVTLASVSGPDFAVTYGGAGAQSSGRLAPRLPVELAPISHLRVLTARSR